MNPYLFLLRFLPKYTILGVNGGRSYWKNFQGYCKNSNCAKSLKARDGIFCANFFHVHGPFSACQGAWCGDCFGEIGSKTFPVRVLRDEEGKELIMGDEVWRFKKGRKGDHLMVPFQCEMCHFRNILGRNLMRGLESDRELEALMRRASLDAFWSWAPSTVTNNLREAARSERFADRVGIPSITPALGPFPLSDVLGMRVTVAVLDRSLDPGLHEEFVQWNMFRTLRSAVTNISQAGVQGLGNVVGAYERNRTWISEVPTHTFWFTRFMSGLHKHVGEVRKQDEAVTIDVMWEIKRILQAEWERATDVKLKQKIVDMGAWFMIGFVLGLRGEEMTQIELAGTTERARHLDDRDPFFVVVVAGRTKGN